MEVINRKNQHEKVSFDKILNRINNLCYELDEKFVDPVAITKETINSMYNGISTRELDNLSSDICGSKIQIHPDFNILASRICISNLHKDTSENYMDVVQMLLNCNIVSKRFADFTRVYKDQIQSMFNYQRDYLFDFFGIKTLERSYLFRVKEKIIERPQHLWMRVSIQIHGLYNWGENDDEVLENIRNTYDLLSNKFFTHATPTLFNSGMERPQLSSCFLFNMEDNIENIFKVIGDIAKISKYSGGIGVTINKIRGKNSLIKGTNGKSDGIVPLCKVLESTARYINQGSKRLGSIACYIEPWHVDVQDFIELRKNTGDENLRTRDLFLALWIPDIFMKKVKENEDWYLMCPDECKELNGKYGEEFDKVYERYVKEGKYKKKINSYELWNNILECQIETGMPYILYKDHINHKSNQKNIGVIKSSNLCVSGDTVVLTKNNGWVNISSLENNFVEIWNGEKWSNSLVRKTSDMAELYILKFSDGTEIKCTPEHKMILEDGKKIDAKDLNRGHNLMKIYSLPFITKIDNKVNLPEDVSERTYYTSGFCSGRPDSVKSINFKVENDMDNIYRYLYINNYERNIIFKIDYKEYPVETKTGFEIKLKKKKINFYDYVPMYENITNRIEWLSGFIDACGTIKNNIIYLSHKNIDILKKVKLMCQTMSVNPCLELHEPIRDIYTMYFNKTDTLVLYHIGINTLLVSLDFKTNNNFNINKKLKLVSIEKTKDEPTWCLHEPEKNLCVFNGILTGNCAEILEYTDEHETAVCNLASINLQSFVEKDQFNFVQLRKVVYEVVQNLDKVIDVNFYPTKETEFSNKRHRPIGLGVQGLADVFCRLNIPYSSDEARQLNKKIFEHIYFSSIRSSCDRSKKLGRYSTFEGSPFSEGKLQWHLWGKTLEEMDSELDWNNLLEDVKKYGTRNSLLTSLMPTASTSQILKNNESFEPFTSNMYLRKTLAGEYVVVNEHLTRKLISLGLWNKEMYQQILYYNGSIQKIKEIPNEIKEIYKTAFEIKQSAIVNQCIERGCFIDQTQSMNLFQSIPNFENLTKSHFYSWQKGLKTGMYYLRTQPTVDPIKFGLDPETIKKINDKNGKEEKEDEKIYCKKLKKIVNGNIETCIVCSS
jgi:ribonucleoside-diphosphate reductase alpha chain